MFRKSSVLAIAVVLLGVTALSVTTPEAEANHVKRLVYPSNAQEVWIPVIAGFKVFPDPLQCGTGPAAGAVLAENTFADPEEVLDLAAGLSFHGTGPNINLWHQTTFAGKGTNGGHTADGQLYFGYDDTGIFGRSGEPGSGGRKGGYVGFDYELPAGPNPLFVAFNTKWAGEWLEGYDHMWVELQPENGNVYILCTLNPEGRGDPSSSEQSAGTCSPYRTICPNDARAFPPFGLTEPLDPAAPHWESRYVEIPPTYNGQTVKIRFTFDSADGVSNGYLGWMLDDVTLTDAVLPSVPDVHPLGQDPPL